MSDNDNDNWEFVSDYSMKAYSNGVAAGDKVRIIKNIVVRDYVGKATGVVYHSGEIWTVLSGVPAEPDIIWLRQKNGERCTWDTECFFETFEKVSED